MKKKKAAMNGRDSGPVAGAQPQCVHTTPFMKSGERLRVTMGETSQIAYTSVSQGRGRVVASRKISTKWYQNAGTSSTPMWITTSENTAEEASGLVRSMNEPMFQRAMPEAK